MSTLHVEYLQLRDALRGSEALRGLPHSQRQACQLFLTVLSDPKATEETIAQVYGPAVSEARRLMEKGVQLGLVLPDAAPTTALPAAAPARVDAHAPLVENTTDDNTTAQAAPSASEQPAAVEQPQDAARSAAPAVEAALGEAPVTETTKTATDEPKASEAPVATEPVVPTDDAPVALALVPHAAEVCASEVLDNESDPAPEILRLLAEIAAAYDKSLMRAIRIGELLTQQKDALEHGEFLPWVAEHLPFSERTARNYMKVFAHRAELESATVADLSAAYQLTAPRKTKPAKTPKPSVGHGTTQPKQDDSQPDTNESTDAHHTEQQPRRDDQPPEARAEESTRSNTIAASTNKKPTSTQAQHDQAPSSNEPSSRTANADRPSDASASSTSEAKPPAPKLTVKHLIGMTVKAASEKHAIALEIIHRTAEAAGLDVLIVDAVTRDAVKELAHLLGNKIDDLAANDYKDACDLLTGIVECLWENVNAHQPDSGERDDDYE